MDVENFGIRNSRIHGSLRHRSSKKILAADSLKSGRGISKFYKKARSFACISDIAALGDSAKVLEKSTRLCSSDDEISQDSILRRRAGIDDGEIEDVSSIGEGALASQEDVSTSGDEGDSLFGHNSHFRSLRESCTRSLSDLKTLNELSVLHPIQNAWKDSDSSMIFSQSEDFDDTLEELEYTTATSSFATKDRIEPTASHHFSRSNDFADSMYEGDDAEVPDVGEDRYEEPSGIVTPSGFPLKIEDWAQLGDRAKFTSCSEVPIWTRLVR
ncbi:hypothetical protein CYMTET_23446 [Cymbomonas tetramitiformis]|uniref:Uncharacterized protein n=1 Tax=Cymbomonas tetramitiformis TaxID=36881 RepID=A0AAE0FZB5_9CHLO|nr:hypothetical protein CYMTET_23446 [Cymbomonas tetramitiformis]